MLPIIRKHGITRIVPDDNFSFWPRLWENFFDDVSPSLQVAGNLDLYEDEKNLYVEAELPGYQRDQIELTLEDGLLMLQAQRSQKEEKKEDTYYIRERRQDSWSRSVRLPVDVQEDKIEAIFQVGVLKVTMEKQPQHSPHKIKVK